ncbi:accessory gene regulator B family protein [Clostridium swellfunianum]|uniref:accessory gene regulator B family protein n=1 Tax=Clostridium swellfunianum TaxID=1367462 RepID=UPI002030BDD1|nr:accessory gene regulator B family protein [Clostridium swellfunianum]MCM0647730.1 accessory gene regulator B family protein [Clostridium swellfunianum]
MKEGGQVLTNIAEDITIVLLRNKIIDMDDRDIYIYGLQVILSTLIVTGSLLTLGIIFHEIPLTLGFMLTFISLRTYTGGYHANKFNSCFTISMTIYLGQLLLSYIVPNDLKITVGISCVIISSLIIYKLSPIEHKNNPLSQNEKTKYRKISRIIIAIIFFFTLLGLYFNKSAVDFYFMVSLTVMAVAILMLISLLKGGVQDEQGKDIESSC